jgi:hypothetical protein
MCKKEDMSPAINLAIEDVIDEEGHTWGLVDKIKFSPSGEYGSEELERRIALLTRKTKRH